MKQQAVHDVQQLASIIFFHCNPKSNGGKVASLSHENRLTLNRFLPYTAPQAYSSPSPTAISYFPAAVRTIRREILPTYVYDDAYQLGQAFAVRQYLTELLLFTERFILLHPSTSPEHVRIFTC
nr:hypothetical protein [Paenibacillus andongensis]